MDHPAELSAARPWRAAALVAAAVAAVELFILLLVGLAFATKLFSSEVAQATETAVAKATAADVGGGATEQAAGSGAAATAAVDLLPRSETSVIVLNGNGVAGAAGITAERLRRLRYLIAGTDNAPRSDFRRPLVMYRPGRKGEARRLARDLHVRRVAPLDGMRVRDLQGAHLAFIVGG